MILTHFLNINIITNIYITFYKLYIIYYVLYILYILYNID